MDSFGGKYRPPKGYISNDIISYPYIPMSSKRIFPITFWKRIFWGYNILILGVSKFYILYPFLELIANFGILFPSNIQFFVKKKPERL
jgi:hypothetical protein